MPETMIPVKSKNGATPHRTTPFAWFDNFASDMERFWTRPFSYFTPLSPFQTATREPFTWAPLMDVYEKDHTLVVKAELPGLKKEDVEVEVDGDQLVIRGQSKAETEVKEEDYYRTERRFGSFYRRMVLPAGVKPDQVEAILTDGVLEVHIPQPIEAKPEPTKVQVN